jgi:putative membrane protein
MTLLAMVADWEALGRGVGASLLFGLIGIVLLLVGFKAFEKVTPKLNVEEELAKGNMAVGVVVAALLLAIGLIIMLVVS